MSISQALGLPYVPGRYGGGERIITGCWPILSGQNSGLSSQIQVYLKSCTSLDQDFTLKVADDPLGVLLGHSPLRDWETYAEGNELLSKNMYNPYFLTLINEHLEIVIETCIVNNVALQLPMQDKTLVNRLWQQILPLTIIPANKAMKNISVDTVDETREEALSQIEENQPNIRNRIHKNWRDSDIDRRGGGPQSVRRKYELLQVSDPAAIIRNAGRWSKGLSAGLGSSLVMQDQTVWNDSQQLALVRHEGGLGAGHFEEIVEVARSMATLGQAATMVMVTAFVDPARRKEYTVTPIENFYAISSDLPDRSAYTAYDTELCLAASTPFLRLIPKSMLDRYKYLAHDYSSDRISQAMEAFLRTIEGYLTIGNLKTFLSISAPLIYDVDRTFGTFGFYDGQAFGGWVAYARHDPKIAVLRSRCYFLKIGCDVDALAQASAALPSCGSGGVIAPALAPKLFGELDRRLQDQYPITGVEDVDVLSVARWNGTVAIFSLALQCLSFRRPYPFTFPNTDAKSELIYEKLSPRKILYGPVGQSLMQRINEKYRALLTKIEAQYDLDFDPENVCCAFLAIPMAGLDITPHAQSNASRIVTALCEDRDLCEFGGIFPGFPRHTADFALRLGGCTDSQIDILSDHSTDRMRSRLGESCLEGYATRELHTHAEALVAKHIYII